MMTGMAAGPNPAGLAVSPEPRIDGLIAPSLLVPRPTLTQAALALSGESEAGRALPGVARLSEAPRPENPDSKSAESGKDAAEAEFLHRAGLGAAAAAAVEVPDSPASDYLLGLADQTRRTFARHFPLFHREFPLTVAHSGRTDTDMINASHDVSPYGKSRMHHIVLLEKMPPGKSNERELAPTAFSADDLPSPLNRAVRRGLARILTFFHEYAHGVFHEIIPSISRGFILPEEDGIRINAETALNEGFAVMLELLLVDKMLSRPGDFGLGPEEIEDARSWKAQRLRDMRHARNHYTQGTFYFIHKIYKQEGEAGLLKFLEDLDTQRLYELATHDLPFRLLEGRPELFKAYLTNSGDQATRAAVDALADYLAGADAPEQDLDRLRDILKRVDVSALARLLNPLVKTSVTRCDPSLCARLIARIARLSQDTAKRLADACHLNI